MTESFANDSLANGTATTEGGPSGILVAATQTVICVVSLLWSCFSNALLLYVLLRCKELRTDSNILVADLVIVDLLNIFTNFPLFVCSAVLDLRALRGAQAAWWMSTLHVAFSYMTLTTMFLMMIERFLAIRFPLRLKSTKTTTKVLLAVLVKWVATLATVLGVYVPLRDIDLGERPVIEYKAAYSRTNSAIGRIFTPLVLVVSVLLFVICRKVIQDSLREQQHCSLPADQRFADRVRKQRAINTIFIVIIMICFSYVPLFLRAALPLGLSGSARQWLLCVLSLVLFFPAIFNPLIYFMRVGSFRSALKELARGGSVGERHWRRNSVQPRRVNRRLQKNISWTVYCAKSRELPMEKGRRWSNMSRAQTKSSDSELTVNSRARRHSI